MTNTQEIRKIVLDIDEILFLLETLVGKYMPINNHELVFMAGYRYPIVEKSRIPEKYIKLGKVSNETIVPFKSIELVCRVLNAYYINASGFKNLYYKNVALENGHTFISKFDLTSETQEIVTQYLQYENNHIIISDADMEQILRYLDNVTKTFMGLLSNDLRSNILEFETESHYFIVSVRTDIRAYRYMELLDYREGNCCEEIPHDDQH